MAKIAKVGMKTDIWHTSSKERPRPASQYRAIFDVLNHKLQKIKWKWQHIQSGKTGHRQNYLHISLAFLCVSSIPSHPHPLVGLPSVGGQGLHMARLPLVTKENWADNPIPLSWSRRIWVTATSRHWCDERPWANPFVSPDFSSLSTREDKTIFRISSGSEFCASGMLVT